MTGRYKRRKGGAGGDPKGQRVACSHTRVGVMLIPVICSGQTKGMLTEIKNRN